MAYTLSNKCAKNLCKRTVIFQIIIKVWSHFFLEHDVYIYLYLVPFFSYMTLKKNIVTLISNLRSLTL